MEGKRAKLSEQTADRLYEWIVEERRYPPGSKLPNENELSESMGVSRTTLREAISFLVASVFAEPMISSFAALPFARIPPIMAFAIFPIPINPIFISLAFPFSSCFFSLFFFKPALVHQKRRRNRRI